MRKGVDSNVVRLPAPRNARLSIVKSRGYTIEKKSRQHWVYLDGALVATFDHLDETEEYVAEKTEARS